MILPPLVFPGQTLQLILSRRRGKKVLRLCHQLTGFVPSELSEAQKMCDEMGLEVTSQARLATHLVMPSLNRTIAFLCAINYVKFVLSIDWIKDSHKEKKLLGKCKQRPSSLSDG